MLFSIITVVLNCVDTIERTIHSVLNQSCKDREYIIIDGKSTDGTLGIIEKYKDSLACFVSEPDSGIYDAMNKGILHSRGEYIIFMNANDWLEDNALQDVADYIRKNPVDIIYGYVNAYVQGVRDGYCGISEETDYEELHLDNLYCHQGLFVKRNLFKAFGMFDTQYRILADYDWILRAHTQGCNVALLGKTVANFTVGGACSCDANVELIKREKDQIRKKYLKNHAVVNERFSYIKGKVLFHILFDEHMDVLSNFFRDIQEVYIWGTGYYGKICLEIYRNSKCRVSGFVESVKNNNDIMGVKVYSTEELQEKLEQGVRNNVVICVAVEKYEQEIRQRIDSFNMPVRVIGISDLFNYAVEAGSIYSEL